MYLSLLNKKFSVYTVLPFIFILSCHNIIFNNIGKFILFLVLIREIIGVVFFFRYFSNVLTYFCDSDYAIWSNSHGTIGHFYYTVLSPIKFYMSIYWQKPDFLWITEFWFSQYIPVTTINKYFIMFFSILCYIETVMFTKYKRKRRKYWEIYFCN